MKQAIILFFILATGLSSRGQIDCTIYPGDTTVCYGSRITLTTLFADTLNYFWHHSGETSVFVDVVVRETSTYKLTVTNKSNTLSCSDSVTISVYPKRLVVEFVQTNKGCPDECKAQVRAVASEGYPPYSYQWSAKVAPNDSSLALGLCSVSNYAIRVIDTVCTFDTAYMVEGYNLPEIELTVNPDSIYRVNPVATFSFENKSEDTIPLTNWIWKFGDGFTTNELSPTHVFEKPDTVAFIFTTIDGCVDTIYTSVELKELKLEVPNVFTPNGDGANDLFKIPELERYASNLIVIFDRWGKKVYERSNYSGDWDGGSLPDGVYYYILRCYGYWEEEVFKGAITILGSDN